MDGPQIPSRFAENPSTVWTRRLQCWLLVLLLLGVLWRTVRYLLRFPIWGDEAFVCLNLINQTYLGLTAPLHLKQVAPLLFWWGELTSFRCLGSSELALRLLPFMAGVGGLLLFWRLAHLTLPPLARTIAVGFLAVAIWPVSMSTLVKPYSFDLFLSAILLVPAVEWLRRPDRLGWLVVLLLAGPLAVLGSFPAVFVAGSVSLALLPAVWRRPGWKARALFAGYNVLMLAGFGITVVVGLSQVDSNDKVFNDFMQGYWGHGFPPLAPLALLEWLLLINTGQLMAYPMGGSNGLSALTFLLFLVGLWQLWRLRQRALLVLCLGPFVLGLLAAFLHRYPYGASCRLSQHVSPAICLLGGLGVAALIDCIRSDLLRRRWVTTVCGCLAVVGAGGVIKDLLRPYRGEGDLFTRQLVQQLIAQSGPEDQIVVLNQEDWTDVVFRWQLARFRGHVGWSAALDLDRLSNSTGQVWCVGINGETTGLESVKEKLAQSGRTWILTNQIPYTMVPSNKKEMVLRCDVYRWIAPGSPTAPKQPQAVSVWP